MYIHAILSSIGLKTIEKMKIVGMRKSGEVFATKLTKSYSGQYIN